MGNTCSRLLAYCIVWGLFFKAQPNRLRGKKERPITSFKSKREKEFIHSLLCFQETYPDITLPIHQENCSKCKHRQDGASKGEGLAPVSPDPASILGYFCISEFVLLELLTSREDTAASRLPSAICLCKISRIHLLFVPRNMLYTQKEDIEETSCESWAELSPAGVGTGFSRLWRHFHPNIHVTGVLHVPQGRAQLTASDTTLTGSFAKLTRSKKSCRIPGRISP